MRGIVGVSVALVVLFAGCAGSESGGPKASKDLVLTDAADPTADSETGSVNGRVIDEEKLPVVGATVTLAETKQAMLSDTRGNFTFNRVAPGKITVIVEKLGFDSAARQIQVKAGEVQTVNFFLTEVEVVIESYTASVPLVGHINLGHAWTDYYGGWDLASQFCTKCEFYVHLKPNPVDIKFEASWQKPINQPVFAEEIYYLIRKNWNNDTVTSQDNAANTQVVSGYWEYGPMPRDMEPRIGTTPPDNETAIKNMKNVKALQIRLGGGFYSVAYEQKVEMWMSFTYNGPFSDEFSAFPKG